MKRNYIILSVFLVLGIIVIIISIYIARQSLREITKEEKKLQIQTTAGKPTMPAVPLEQRKEPLETKTEEGKPEEIEFADLSQIPDDYIEEIERKGEIQEELPEETVSTEERKLDKQPNLKELKELKSRGVIIY